MNHFDEMAKALAEGLTRRQALRKVGGGLAGALLASLGLGKAWGQADDSCPDYCRRLGLTPGHGNAFGKCVSNCARCKGTLCGADACCTGALVCAVFGTHGVCGECGRISCNDPIACAEPTCSGGGCVCGTSAEGEDVCVQTGGICTACMSDDDCSEGRVCVQADCRSFCEDTGGRYCGSLCEAK
jgi:hypothetical protein